MLFTLAAICASAQEPVAFDMHGNAIHQFAGPGVHVLVLIFAATDCPISNRYVPEIARLNRKFSAQGVRFLWVFPNPQDTAGVVIQHKQEFGIQEGAVLDSLQSLVAWAHVTVTPEAAVFAVDDKDSSLREVYHGRIDDRYLSLGQERLQPEHRELQAAIAAALAGKPVPQPAGPPIGCSIVYLQK
jgi:hypothetical protein